jgi:hypothetical protein
MFKMLLAAYLAGQAGDVGTTAAALQMSRFREANRLVGPGTTRIVLTKAVVDVPTVLAASAWRKSHPKLAFVLLGAGTAIGAYATVHNARVLATTVR